MDFIILIIAILFMMAHALLFKFSTLLGVLLGVFIVGAIIGICIDDEEEMSIILIITYCLLVGLFYFIISMINYSPNF